jgi:MFS family permease
VLFGVGAVTTIALRAIPAHKAMLAGLVALLPSLVLLILSQSERSMPLLIAGTAVGGISSALGYRGSLEVVNEIAPDDKKSEVVSAYLIASYLGNSVPVIGVGLLSNVTTRLIAHIIFAAVVGLFAVAGLVTGVKYPPSA